MGLKRYKVLKKSRIFIVNHAISAGFFRMWILKGIV